MAYSSETSREVQQRADALAQRLTESDTPLDELDALLNAIRALGARFEFDRQGRPGAIAAVRHALPSIERDLFDAVVEDHQCEVAALVEAVWQLAAAMTRGRE